MRGRGVIVGVLLVVVALASLGWAPPAAGAQDAERTERAAATARALAELEAERDFDGLYDKLHPDARAVAPREAVVGWYAEALAGREAGALTVTAVRFDAWTWGVTGETYEDAVEVAFVQEYTVGGVTTETAGVMHLVESAEGWGWFFGASREFVDRQIERYGGRPIAQGIVSAFPSILDADVDLFWQRRFADAALDYDPPAGIVPFDAPLETKCGLARPRRQAAFYCGRDETIYYNVEFRAMVEGSLGDFGWVTVIAHEWGHHIQSELFEQRPDAFDFGSEVETIELELQADCLAGAYTRDAEARGWLDPGDLDEALGLTFAVGDPAGTARDDPNAHGTGEQRVEAFREGYEAGLAGCGVDLDDR